MSDCEEPCGYPQMDCALGVYIIMSEDIEELEAKLAKAVEALKKLDRRGDALETFDPVVHEIVTAALAELEGETK